MARDWIPAKADLGDSVYPQQVLEVLEGLAPDGDSRWVRAGLGLPIVVFCWLMGYLLLKRRWRLAGLQVLLVAVASVARLAEQLLLTTPPAFDRGQYISWQGWQWMWLCGVYDAGWLLLLILPVWVAARRLWRERRPAPALATPA
jgi:hypothetical protein